MLQVLSSGSVWMRFRAVLNLADQGVTGVAFRSEGDQKATETPTIGMVTPKPAALEPLSAFRQ